MRGVISAVTSHLHPPARARLITRGLLSAGLLSPLFVSHFESLRPDPLLHVYCPPHQRSAVNKESILQPLAPPQRPSGFFFVSPGKNVLEGGRGFPFLTERFSGFFCPLSLMLDSLHPWFPDLPQPPSASAPRPGRSWPFLLSANSWMAEPGGREACRDEERMSSKEDDGRLPPLPGGLAAGESRLILSSVDGGNPAERGGKKKAFVTLHVHQMGSMSAFRRRAV